MGGGSTIRHHIDRRLVDVVILVLRGLFLQSVDKNLAIGLGDAADQLIRRHVIKINHCMLPRTTCLANGRASAAALYDRTERRRLQALLGG